MMTMMRSMRTFCTETAEQRRHHRLLGNLQQLSAKLGAGCVSPCGAAGGAPAGAGSHPQRGRADHRHLQGVRCSRALGEGQQH